jgi:hypothetical protein
MLAYLKVSGVHSPGFLASYWSAEFVRFLQVSALSSHWLEDCVNFMPTPEENDQYSANHLVQYKQQANPLLPMNNYDKNKQLKLLSQHKLAINAINTLFGL